MATAEHAGAILTIDLDAIVANWRFLRSRSQPATCAAVVKANAYGLGIAPVARALRSAGCRDFFVASLDEAIELHTAFGGEAATIWIFNPPIGATDEIAERGFVPCLSRIEEIEHWAEHRGENRPSPVAIKIDTGMSRLGLPAQELDRLVGLRRVLNRLEIALIMSHLACADEPENPMNRVQLARFAVARGRLPPARASLANSSGIFLGPEFHFNLVRAGAAIYGLAPVADAANPMRQVVRLDGRILQLRDVDAGGSVGYGATHRFDRRRRLATVAVGYADGYLRSLSKRGSAFLGDVPIPLVGRVSMDLVTFDVSGAPAELVRPGARIELLGPNMTPDALGALAGTIGYEILTALGRRYHRVYIGGV